LKFLTIFFQDIITVIREDCCHNSFGHHVFVLFSNLDSTYCATQYFAVSRADNNKVLYTQVGALTFDLGPILIQRLISFPNIILSSMKSLHEVLFATIGPRMSILVSEGVTVNDMLSQSDVLRVWSNVLSFGRWLRIEGSVPPFGKRLAAKIVSANANASLLASPIVDLQLEELCSGTLAILLDEFHNCSESSRMSHLDAVIATYVSLCRISGSNGELATLTAHKISIP
jgi:hypothetical protein